MPSREDAAADLTFEERGTPARPTLVYSVEVSAPPETVWEHITDPRYTRRYFYGYGLTLGAAGGGAVVYETPDGRAHIVGTLLERIEGRRLRMSVRVLRDADTAKDAPSRVTWEIEPIEGGSRVTVIHDDFEGTTATLQVVRRGWPLVLIGLRELLDTGSAANARARWPAHVQRPDLSV